MAINIDSILEKTNSFLGSKRGTNIVAAKNKNAKKYEYSSKEIVDAFKNYLKTIVSQTGIESINDIVWNALDTAKTTKPKYNESKHCYVVDIIFDKSKLKRESLLLDMAMGEEIRSGDGIDNIIALFNNGYKIKKVHQYGSNVGNPLIPRGIWKTHTGQELEVSAKPSREPLKFMQNAQQGFMEAYGDKYGIISIEISDDYKKIQE